jgi:N-acetylneuraminic acid mutarotase
MDGEVEVETKIYVLRGFLFFSYDVNSQTWTRMPDCRRDRGHFQMVAHDGFIYAIGTQSLISGGTVEKFNPVTNQWSISTPMPLKLRSVGAAVFNGHLCITGGFNVATAHAVDHFYKWDASAFEWKTVSTAPLRTPRFRHAAITFKDHLWIAGGATSVENDASSTNTVEIYSDAKGWVSGPSMNRKRAFLDLMVVEGKLYAVGGDIDDEGADLVRSIEVLHEAADGGMSWEVVTVFRNARKGFCACAAGSKIYVFAGDGRITDEHEDNQTLSTWDAFDLGTGIWESQHVDSRLRPMPLIDNWGQALALTSPRSANSNTPTAVGTKIRLPKPRSLQQLDQAGLDASLDRYPIKKSRVERSPTGKVYVLRGFMFFNCDLSTRRWTRLPDCLRDRGHFQMVALDGYIYAVGTHSVISGGTVERFNTATNQWSMSTAMPQKLRSVGATQHEGHLYITGGLTLVSEEVVGMCFRLNTNSVWETIPPLTTPRCKHDTASFKGRLWVAGGATSAENASTNSVEMYSEATGWVAGPPLQRKRAYLHLLIVQGRLYAVGGDVDEEENLVIRTIEALRVEEDRWELITYFPNERKGFSACAGSPLGYSHYVYCHA